MTRNPLPLLLMVVALPGALALDYAIDCPPHGAHCALDILLEADIVSKTRITQDPAGVEAGADASIRVAVEAVGAGAGGEVTGEVLVNVTPTSGVEVSEPSVQVANVTVGGPAVDLEFPLSFAPGLTAGQVIFVPLSVTQGSDAAATHVPFTIVGSITPLAALGEVATKPLVVAPLSAFLGGLLVWLRARRPGGPLEPEG